MHSIEPHYLWRNLYVAAEDPYSPFFGSEYSEFEFTNTLYDHLIHPQWDDFGSTTLFLKILFVDYEKSFAILEFMGEWNDTLYNDIMVLKREVIDLLVENGIHKFIILGENVLNFHASDDSYYQEWSEDIEDGWIALMNFRDQVLNEFDSENISQYFVQGGTLEDIAWRTQTPLQLFENVDSFVEDMLV